MQRQGRCSNKRPIRCREEGGTRCLRQVLATLRIPLGNLGGAGGLCPILETAKQACFKVSGG